MENSVLPKKAAKNGKRLNSDFGTSTIASASALGKQQHQHQQHHQQQKNHKNHRTFQAETTLGTSGTTTTTSISLLPSSVALASPSATFPSPLLPGTEVIHQNVAPPANYNGHHQQPPPLNDDNAYHQEMTPISQQSYGWRIEEEE